jgi:acetylornithine deacetylase/succinyl-diaminopimelate desuccinylase family protein
MTASGEARTHADLLARVQAYREAMIDLTTRLIAIPTQNPPGDCYSEALQLLQAHLLNLGFENTRLEGHCLLSFLGVGEPTLYFSGHYDVVPAQSPSQFQPVKKDAKLFGRGSSDMKSGLAAMIYAAKALSDCGLPRNGRIGMVFVPDEETAGPRGSRYLAERGLLGQNAIGMLTPEPTGGVVWNANRGAITIKITLKGKSAHVGRQREGVNAFEQMLQVAQALSKLKAEVEERATAYRIAPDSLRRSILMMGGQCQSGTNFNLVPNTCTFTVDRRINPEEDFQAEKQRLLSLFDDAREEGINLDVEILQEGASSGISEHSSVGRALALSIQEITGRQAQFEMCPGLLETRFYAERGIPAFAYGPGLLTVSHGPNEFVPIDRIVQCASIYGSTAAQLLAEE